MSRAIVELDIEPLKVIEVDGAVTRFRPVLIHIDDDTDDDDDTKEEEDEGSDESETRPKVVIHITVKPGGPTHIPTAEVRVIRSSNQRVKVYSELRVEQETIDIDRGTDTYTTLWRSDGKPIQFQIEIREAKPPPSLATYQWEGPGLPSRKIDRPKVFKREEAASSLSSQGSN